MQGCWGLGKLSLGALVALGISVRIIHMEAKGPDDTEKPLYLTLGHGKLVGKGRWYPEEVPRYVFSRLYP